MRESAHDFRAAARNTLRDLRRSILAGRAMSLPNLLRLYRRRTSAFASSATDIESARLQRLYRARQPFRDSARRQAKSALGRI